MKAPGTAYDDPLLGRDPQPAHMRDNVHQSDNGGVHVNSGIPNHAFCLGARRSTATPGRSSAASGTRNSITSSATSRFADMARETVATAGELFGRGGQVQSIIAEACDAVGVRAFRRLIHRHQERTLIMTTITFEDTDQHIQNSGRAGGDAGEPHGEAAVGVCRGAAGAGGAEYAALLPSQWRVALRLFVANPA